MIKVVELTNFRNHEYIKLEFLNPKVYIGGLNGIGKTSILEAIYFAATTKSYRTKNDLDLVLENKPFSKIHLLFEDNTKIEIIISKTGKRIIVNGYEKRRISDYIGQFSVVMFTTEDINLIKGTPADKRNFIDLEWMQLDKQYLANLNKYRKILKQRNALLKNIEINDDYTFLNILGEQLFQIGSKIIKKRENVIDMLNKELKKSKLTIDGDIVQIVYKPNVTVESFKKAMKNKQKQDIMYQTTNYGPHKDDFMITIGGKEAKNFASSGEQRLAVIAVKFALIGLIKEIKGINAILLLDDILSELDQKRQQLFFDSLPEENQVIMTSVNKINNDNIQIIEMKE